MPDLTAAESARLLRRCAKMLEPENATIQALLMGAEALEASVPRVLTLEEACARDYGCVVYAETKGADRIESEVITATSDFQFIDCKGSGYFKDSYSTGYRFWTIRPTAEQMAATPWSHPKISASAPKG